MVILVMPSQCTDTGAAAKPTPTSRRSVPTWIGTRGSIRWRGRSRWPHTPGDGSTSDRASAPRTCELYESELRLHILPALGSIEVAKLTTSTVRSWHAELLKAGRPGPTTVAKCYRLLRVILTTAVEDGLVLNFLIWRR